MWEIGNSKNIIYFYTKTIRSEQRRNDSCDKEFELEAEGLLARCILHENDHLDGIVYVDKVEGRLYNNEELQSAEE